MARQEVRFNFKVKQRRVEVVAYDTVGPEDVYTTMLRGAVHRIATGENLIEPAAREVKDWIIRTNLFV